MVVVVGVIGVELDHSFSGQCWRVGPGGVSTGELILPAATGRRDGPDPLSTRQSRRAGPGGAGTGELAG